MQPLQERSVLLLPLNQQGTLRQNLQSSGIPAASFSENEAVTVQILSTSKSNTVRIAVKGVVMQVKALSAAAMQEGAFLLMRVHLAGDTVVLTPYKQPIPAQIPHDNVFAQLNLPHSELAAALITFLLQNEQPLESKQLAKLLSSLAAFSPHEKKAAFIAALLISRGMEPAPELIAYYLQEAFSIPLQHGGLDTDYDEADLFRILNHIKTARNHWVVFPFKKQLTVEWQGALAFLLDMQDTRCLECCVRAHSEESRENWIFTLKNHECLFSYRGVEPLSPQQEQAYTSLLTACLAEVGVLSYTVRPASGSEQHYSLASIDISV